MVDENVLIALFMGAILIGVMVLYFSVTSPSGKLENTPQNFAQLVANENPEDTCAVPPGTDPAQWKEHLGHHPDRYAQCLK